MKFIHEYLWYLNQCFTSSALRASQSLLFEFWLDYTFSNSVMWLLESSSGQDKRIGLVDFLMKIFGMLGGVHC